MSWAVIVKFFTDNPVVRWITYAALVLIGWEVVKRHLKEAGREAERAAIAKKQAEVKIAVQERSTQIINEERTHADEAIRARDTSPSYPTPDVMPDDLRRVIFGDKGGS
jgi:hypothetical protein